MNAAVLALAIVLGPIALFGLSGSASADQIEDYNWHNAQGLYPWSPTGRSNCRVVEVRTTNRWGTDVTIHRRICD